MTSAGAIRRSIAAMPAAAALLIWAPIPALPGTAHARGAPQAGYENPILFADYSDPDVVRVGEDYYLTASSFHLSPGLPILHSRDLVHWRIIGHVLPRLDFAAEYDMPGPFALDDTKSKPVAGTRYASGVWAPAIRHHDGLFYVTWATPDEGVFVATAKRPEGPWSAPVHLIAEAGLEDPAPFWDDDGTAWLVHGRVGAGPLILHRMSADATRILDTGQVIAEDPVNLPVLEGPKLYKRDGWYYIFAPVGGVEKGDQAVLRSRDIRGPYEARRVLRPGDTAVQGPHQGGWVETPGGEGWFAHFNSTGAFGRIVYLEPLEWRDGWPLIGAPVAGEVWGQPVARHAMPVVASPPTDARLQDSDDFLTPELGLQWSWNHNPDDTRWSLSERPGWLRLKAGRAQHLTTSRGTLTQILQGPGSRITTRVSLAGMADGQRAGLSLFGVGPSWIGVRQDGARRRLVLSSKGEETAGPALRGDDLYLRATVAADQTVRYAYSIDGAQWRPVGDAIPLARFSWWKGSRPALFTYNRKAAAGAFDVDWFAVDTPWPGPGGDEAR